MCGVQAFWIHRSYRGHLDLFHGKYLKCFSFCKYQCVMAKVGHNYVHCIVDHVGRSVIWVHRSYWGHLSPLLVDTQKCSSHRYKWLIMWADHSVAWIVCLVGCSGSWRCRGPFGPIVSVLATDINGWSWKVIVVLQKVLRWYLQTCHNISPSVFLLVIIFSSELSFAQSGKPMIKITCPLKCSLAPGNRAIINVQRPAFQLENLQKNICYFALIDHFIGITDRCFKAIKVGILHAH